MILFRPSGDKQRFVYVPLEQEDDENDEEEEFMMSDSFGEYNVSQERQKRFCEIKVIIRFWYFCLNIVVITIPGQTTTDFLMMSWQLTHAQLSSWAAKVIIYDFDWLHKTFLILCENADFWVNPAWIWEKFYYVSISESPQMLVIYESCILSHSKLVCNSFLSLWHKPCFFVITI